MPISPMPRSERRGGIESAKVLPRYAKRTMRQVAEGARKRRAVRTKADDLSE